MVLKFFRQEQYKYHDLESLNWIGDDKLQKFYTMWKVITIGMVIPLADIILCDMFLDRIRPSNNYMPISMSLIGCENMTRVRTYEG